jgi:hypothetical protein
LYPKAARELRRRPKHAVAAENSNKGGFSLVLRAYDRNAVELRAQFAEAGHRGDDNHPRRLEAVDVVLDLVAIVDEPIRPLHAVPTSASRWSRIGLLRKAIADAEPQLISSTGDDP